MGLLSSGIKAARTATRSVPDTTNYTKPKKKINPLVKPREQIFESPDLIETPTDYFGDPVEPDLEIIGKLYSPVYSAIEEMPIGKQGTKGENISAYLNKRAPNVEKAELESFGLELDPNRRYTKEEVLSLAKEKGTTDYTIEKHKYTEYEDEQRQGITDKEVDYVELTVQGKQEYTGSEDYTHLGGKQNIAHARSSIRSELPEDGPLAQKISDRPRYLLIEEMQSDLVKNRNNPELKEEDWYISREYDIYLMRTAFDDFADNMDIDYEIYIDRNVIRTIQKHYYEMYSPDRIEGVDELKKVRKDDSFRITLIKKLKEEHNIDAQGKDIDTVSLDAIRKSSDTSQGEADWNSGGEYQIEPDQHLENEAKDLFRHIENNVDSIYSKKATQADVNKLPIATRTEYVKKLLLANIAYAKQNNITKIVIPNYKEIAKQRIDNFDMVTAGLQETNPLVIKYNKAVKEGTVNELAQEYYEGVFKTIYKDAVKKAINQLNNETNNVLKTKTKELTYPDLTESNRVRKSNALEIDITDFEYDPKTDAFRFKEGGVVGTKTNKKTQAGRDVYETPEGEMVSEKSTTFKYKGQWINIPSIHEGNRYDDDTLILMLEAGLIEPTSVHKNRKEAEQAARKRSDSLKFNQGGTPMLEQQMELFEDGGLRDEGGEVDEVSGNEVPIGGTKKGVRDDVPAMVSEGEFVFPEDVTRYIGLDKLMQMRQEAKMGLKRMDAMGQMGNGDEATMPDDMPFGMADLIVVAGDTGEELEMAEGGFVTRPTTARRTQPQQQPTYAQPTAERPPEFRSTRALTPAIPRPARSNISFRDLVSEAVLEFKEYRNEDGQSLLIAFVGGKPVYPIPAGYTLYNPEAVGEEPSETTETAEETNEIIKQATSGSDKKDAGDLPKSEFQLAGSWDGASLDLVYKEGSKFVGGVADLAAGAVGVLAGPLAPVVYLFTKLEKRKYESKLDGYIARAKKEGRQDLVEKFTAHKKALAEGGQGLIGKAINAVSKIFSPEDVKTEITNAAISVSREPANVKSDVVNQIVSTAPSYATMYMGEAGRGAPTTQAPVPETAETIDAGSYLTQRFASGQGGDSFTGGDYDVVSTDPNFVSDRATLTSVLDSADPNSASDRASVISLADRMFREGRIAEYEYEAIKRNMSTDMEKARYNIQRLRMNDPKMPMAYMGGVGSEGYNKGIQEAINIFGIDTVREAESNLASDGGGRILVGEAPLISKGEIIHFPEEATRDLSGISTAMNTRSNIAARPTPQVELTQQPTATFPQGYPVDNQVGISAGTTTKPFEPIVNAPPRKTDVVTTDMQLAPVQPDLSAVPEYMDTDTSTPSYGPVPADPRIPRRFTGTDPFKMQDTSDTLAAFDLSPAPQESGTFTKDGISMLPSADVSDLSTEAYISSQQPPSLQEEALRLLDEDAQTRLANVAKSGDVTAIVENANKVMSDINADTQVNIPEPQTDASTLQTGPAVRGRNSFPPSGAALSDPRIDVSRQPFIDAPYPVEEPVEDTKPFVGSLDAASQYKPYVGSLDAASQYKQKSETFDEAFARNKREGEKTFTYKGNKYTTETKEEKAAKEAAAKPKKADDPGYSKTGYTLVDTGKVDSKGQKQYRMPTADEQSEQRIAATTASQAGKDPVKAQKDTAKSQSSKSTNVASSGRSETDVQSDINAALKASGDEWTSELNDLVAERDSARANEGTKKSSSSSKKKSSSSSSSSSSDKSIVCTEMYRQTQLVDWQHAMKTWDVYQKRYLTPYHETGYHWLFQPYVKGMKKSSVLTDLGAMLAKHRTQHLRHVLTKGKAKDDIIGNVWCKIIHPLVYVAGIVKEKIGK